MANPLKLSPDEAACFTGTAANEQERTAACERLGLYGMPTGGQGLSGGAPQAREVAVPKRGCRRASWQGTAWKVQPKTERAGTKVNLGPAEVLVCGTRIKPKALAQFLPGPALAVALGKAAGGLAADLVKVEVEFTFGQDGLVHFVINGVKGPGCTSVSEAIKKALKLTTISDTKTGEYYEEPVSITQQATVKTKYSL